MRSSCIRDLIASAPRDLVVSAGLDTLALAVEGLIARGGDPLADASLMHALRLLAQHLPDPALDQNIDARAGLIFAAVLSGQGTDHTGAGIATVLGHAIGARHEVDNGAAKAIVLPHVLAFNADAAEQGFGKIAASLGLAGAGLEPIRAALARIGSGLGVPRRLRDVGVPRDALPDLAARGMGDWFLRGSPRPVREATELLHILEAAW